VRKEDLIAFAGRDWCAIAIHKQQRWAEQKGDMTVADALRIGDELRHHLQTIRDDWPSEADRRDDLACHLRVSEMLRRVKPSNSR